MAVNGRDEEAGVERSESVVVDDEESCVREIIDGVCVDGRGGGVGCGGGERVGVDVGNGECFACLLYTSPSPRDESTSRMPSSA